MTCYHSSLPRDPFKYYVPHSKQTLSLSHYGRQLPRADVLSCLLQAMGLVIRQLNNAHDQPISEPELQFPSPSNNVRLILYPGSEMTWGMWGTTLRGLLHFVERWEFVVVEFGITELGYMDLVGSGLLVYN